MFLPLAQPHMAQEPVSGSVIPQPLGQELSLTQSGWH